jgi:hypothetical protein
MNIGSFLFRTSEVFFYEPPYIFEYKIAKNAVSNIRCFLFRSSGFFITNIRLFQTNWAPKRTTLTEVRKKNQDEKGLPRLNTTFGSGKNFGLLK